MFSLPPTNDGDDDGQRTRSFGILFFGTESSSSTASSARLFYYYFFFAPSFLYIRDYTIILFGILSYPEPLQSFSRRLSVEKRERTQNTRQIRAPFVLRDLKKNIIMFAFHHQLSPSFFSFLFYSIITTDLTVGENRSCRVQEVQGKDPEGRYADRHYCAGARGRLHDDVVVPPAVL